MGILVAGLIGQVRNKVGNMVFSNWKGINTARAYAVPANPQSVEQTAQRTKFGVVVALAQNLLGTLIATFVDPFSVKMSGFNRFIQLFISGASADGLATTSCQVVAGTLEGVTGLNVEYTTGNGGLLVEFSTIINGNGLGTDDLNILVLDNGTNEIILYQAGLTTRSTGSESAVIATGLLPADLICFAWYSRGTGASFIVSNSNAVAAVAP